MTTNCVNLDNLHEMTGSDKDLEKELFDVYIKSSETCLNRLKEGLVPGKEEEWRTQAHAWKGMSYNLGAQALGDLCAQAQTENLAPEETKKALLVALEAEFEKVRDYLKNVS